MFYNKREPLNVEPAIRGKMIDEFLEIIKETIIGINDSFPDYDRTAAFDCLNKLLINYRDNPKFTVEDVIAFFTFSGGSMPE
jgi:hypothetical protein